MLLSLLMFFFICFHHASTWSYTDCGFDPLLMDFQMNARDGFDSFLPPFEIGDGVPANRSLFYQVSVRLMSNHICGGTIIDDNFVLSAAHCFQPGVSLELYQILAGAHAFNDDAPQQTSGIAKIHFYHGYKGNKAFNYSVDLNNDIVLIELISPFKFNSYVNKACLPSMEYDFMGKTALVSGWGALGEDTDDTPNELQMARVTVIGLEECARYYPLEITKAMVCAKSHISASCKGDSGGPLAIIHDSKTVLLGITSWGKDCGNRDYPGVYTNVSDFLDFIVGTMEGLVLKEPSHADISCADDIKYKDNFCDDENNTEQCGYDGGDCCGFINALRCQECTCKQ